MAINAKPSSDNYVRVYDIEKAFDAAAVDSITSVVASLRAYSEDANGVPQPGAEVSGSPVNLTVVTSEPTAYEGVIPASVTLVNGTRYFLKIVTTAVVGGTARVLTEHHLFTADQSKPRTF